MRARSRYGRPHRRRDEMFWLVVGIVIFVVLIIVGAVGLTASQYMNARTETCTVTDKDRTRTENGSDMRVYTEECGVLKVQDLFFAGEFSSADTFSALKEGETYEFDLSGYRIPLLSAFPIVRGYK